MDKLARGHPRAAVTTLDVDPNTADILRLSQDMADAIGYAFAVPSMCARLPALPVIIGIDWARGFNPNHDKQEAKEGEPPTTLPTQTSP